MNRQRQTRGLAQPPDSVILLNRENGFAPVKGGVLWWHYCRTECGWVATGLGLHTITGSVAEGTLTIRASILCGEEPSCEMHGLVTDMRWE